MTVGEEFSAREIWLLHYGKWLNTGTWLLLPQFSLQRATMSDSPQVSLVHSALPLPEPRVSGCKQNFVCWPFKRLSVSSAISSWQIELLLLFSCMLFGFLSSSHAVGRTPVLCLDPTLLSGNPLPMKYPPTTLVTPCGSPGSPLVPPLHSLSVSLW